ncbi:MAG: hypothetical protein AABW80_03840 [Nanoarchaeota archaeon]
MEKLSSWLFLLIAIVWLLPLIGLNAATAVTTYNWISVIALAIIAITEIVKG